jgi:myosin-7
MIVLIQKVYRGRACKMNYNLQKRSVLVIQWVVRGFLCRIRYLRISDAAVKIQAGVRGWFARDYFRKLKAENKRQKELVLAELARKKEEEMEAERQRAIQLGKPEELAKQLALERETKRKQEELERKKNLEEQELIKFAQKKKEKEKEREIDMQKKKEAPEQPERPLKRVSIIPPPPLMMKENLENNTGALDNLFSFLDDFGATQQGDVIGFETTDFDDIFNMDSIEKVVQEQVIEDIPRIPVKPKALESAPVVVANTNTIAEQPKKPALLALFEKPMKKEESVPVLKFNPLQMKGEEEKIDLSLKAYALAYFEVLPPTHKLYVPAEKLLLHSKNLNYSLTRLKTNSEKLPQKALEIFKCINKILESNEKKQDESLIVCKTIVQMGIDLPDLRDEIFLQVIKQMTPDPDGTLINFEEITVNAWQLLAIISGAFPPSKVFSRYLSNFFSLVVEEQKPLRKNPNTPTTIEKFASYCETTVSKILISGSKKYFPCLMEVSSIKQGSTILCRIYLMDGQVKAIPILSTTTGSEAIKLISEKIELKDPSGWAIFERRDSPFEERMVSRNEYIGDLFSLWEIEKKSSMSVGMYQTVTSKNTQKAIGGGDIKLFFKKRVFKNISDVPTDPVEFSLLVCQAMDDMIRDVYRINEKSALQFAALKAQIEWGNFDPSQQNRL